MRHELARLAGAMKPQGTLWAIVDTTVQPKNDMFPPPLVGASLVCRAMDAKLLDRVREKLVSLARKTGTGLLQSHVRIG